MDRAPSTFPVASQWLFYWLQSASYCSRSLSREFLACDRHRIESWRLMSSWRSWTINVQVPSLRHYSSPWSDSWASGWSTVNVQCCDQSFFTASHQLAVATTTTATASNRNQVARLEHPDHLDRVHRPPPFDNFGLTSRHLRDSRLLQRSLSRTAHLRSLSDPRG